MSNIKQYLTSSTINDKVQSYISCSDIDSRTIISNCLFEMSKNTKISSCTHDSILSCLIQCARYGLSPNSDLGHVYFIPYKNTCTLILGYKGMLTIAYRSGKVKSISAETVYENDFFDYSLGTEQFLKHKKCLTTRGEPVAVYSIARLTNDEYQYKIMTMDEVNKSKDSSSGHSLAKSKGYASIWDKHFDEMAKKTCIRSLFKYLHISPELENAIADDDKNGLTVDAEASDQEENQGAQNESKIHILHDKLSSIAGDIDIDVNPESIPICVPSIPLKETKIPKPAGVMVTS